MKKVHGIYLHEDAVIAARYVRLVHSVIMDIHDDKVSSDVALKFDLRARNYIRAMITRCTSADHAIKAACHIHAFTDYMSQLSLDEVEYNKIVEHDREVDAELLSALDS